MRASSHQIRLSGIRSRIRLWAAPAASISLVDRVPVRHAAAARCRPRTDLPWAARNRSNSQGGSPVSEPLAGGLLLATIAIIWHAPPQVAAAEGEPENPLEPLDTSSPQATIAVVRGAGWASPRRRRWRTAPTVRSMRSRPTSMRSTRTRELFDLSDVPAASQDEVVEEELRGPRGHPAAHPSARSRVHPRRGHGRGRRADAVDAAGNGDHAPTRSRKATAPAAGSSRPGRWRACRAGARRSRACPSWPEDRAITDWRRNSDFSTGPLDPRRTDRCAARTSPRSACSAARCGSRSRRCWGRCWSLLLAALWYRWIGRRGPRGLGPPERLWRDHTVFLFVLL